MLISLPKRLEVKLYAPSLKRGSTGADHPDFPIQENELLLSVVLAS